MLLNEIRREGRRRRSKQLFNGVKEIRGYWKLKGEELDGVLWRSRFVRDCEPLVRQAVV